MASDPEQPRRVKQWPDLLPEWFRPLLAQDRVLNDLWHGRGLPASTDPSFADYDYTIACYLTEHTSNDHDIARIIAMRPTGARERRDKGVEYILRTVEIARAIHYHARYGPGTPKQ